MISIGYQSTGSDSEIFRLGRNVPTVGIELSAFKRAKIKNKPNSQQKSQQLFRNESCPYELLSPERPVIVW